MLYAIVAVVAIIMDQLVKYVVETQVALDAIGEDVVCLLPGFLHVTNVHNYGAAFSFLTGARWFFVILCIIFVLVVIYVLAKDIISTPLARWMAVFVLAGAVGNCIDRIICGYVVDMLEFEFFRFPVFNVADIFITLGAIVFCICVLLEKPKTATKAAPEQIAAAAQAPQPAEVPLQEHSEKTPVTKIPLFRKHQKIEIPDFPKREPAPEAPAMDPNDPFAEWEKIVNAPKQAPEAPAAHVTYSQPAAAEAAQEETVQFKPVQPAVTPVTSPQQAETPAAPAAPATPVTPAAPVQPAAPAPAAEEFNLDDILAEFKDF